VSINKVLQSFNNTGDSILTSEKKQPNSKPAEKREREKETPKQQKKAQGQVPSIYFILSFAG
jgi:hypothetical protein